MKYLRRISFVDLRPSVKEGFFEDLKNLHCGSFSLSILTSDNYCMGLLDILKKIIDFFDVDEERSLPGNSGKSDEQLRTEFEQKGKLFEKYVIQHFDTKNYFSVVDWTRDICDDGICPESNCNPDVIMRYRKTGDKIALECKYRSRYYYSKEHHTQTIRWARPDQIKNYLRYQEENSVPVYVIIGVGNDILRGESPSDMYCVPLNDIRNYPEVFYSYLQRYKRPNPERNFFWDSNKRKLQ